MRKLSFLILLTALAAPAAAQSVADVLRSIEANNLSLAAHGELTQAQRIAARAGNSLPDPNVEFARAWGSPTSLGKTGEVTVTQGFDFPTAYGRRNRLAHMRSEEYERQHGALRQQILLEAKSLCIEVIALRQQRAVALQRFDNIRRLAEVYSRRLEEGSGTVLETGKVEVERVAAENALSMIGIDIETAMGRLRTLNGGLEVHFTDSLHTHADALLPVEEMVDRYQTADPALLASLAGREAARQAVKVSRAEALPKFEAGYKHEFSTGEKFHGLIVGMSVPLFAGRQPIRQAKAEARYAEAQYRSEVNDVRTALTALYDKAAALARSLEEYRGMAARMSRYGSYLDKALQAGQISIVDYFTELTTLYQVREAEIAFERDLRLVEAQINAVRL